MATKLKAHQYAEIFPAMPNEGVIALMIDIQKHGLLAEIVTYQGKILDGRSRYDACERAEIEPRFCEFTGDDKAARAFAVSANLHRRHLTDQQRQLIAGKLAKLSDGERPPSPVGEGHGESAVTQAEAAELLNVSKRGVERAKKVVEKGAKALVDAVQSGDLSMSKAAEIAELPKAEQKKIVREVLAEVEEGNGKPKPPSERDKIRAECDLIVSNVEAVFKRQAKLVEWCGGGDKFVRAMGAGLKATSEAAVALKNLKR